LIDFTDTTIELPTLYEYWVSLKGIDYYAFKRFTESRQAIINSFVVLPLKSDPTKEDTDRDGYLDHADPRPLKSDVTYLGIKDEKYVPIINPDGDASYGGNQGWFPEDNKLSVDYILNYYGCGTIGASDLFLYFALKDTKYENKITNMAIKDNMINYSDYMNYVRYINETYTHTPRWLGVPGPSLSNAINSYFKYAGINHKASWPLSFSKSEMLDKIEEMLEKDIPVIFSIGPNTPDLWGETMVNLYYQKKKGDEHYDGTLNELYQYDENDKRSTKINGHYMTITGIIKDKLSTKHNIMLRISSWGNLYYVDYDEYREYIENEGDKWTSSMIYIK